MTFHDEMTQEDRFWASEDEARAQFHGETLEAELFPDEWKECLGWALAGALVFSWQLNELTRRMDQLFTGPRRNRL